MSDSRIIPFPDGERLIHDDDHRTALAWFLELADAGHPIPPALADMVAGRIRAAVDTPAGRRALGVPAPKKAKIPDIDKRMIAVRVAALMARRIRGKRVYRDDAIEAVARDLEINASTVRKAYEAHGREAREAVRDRGDDAAIIAPTHLRMILSKNAEYLALSTAEIEALMVTIPREHMPAIVDRLKDRLRITRDVLDDTLANIPAE